MKSTHRIPLNSIRPRIRPTTQAKPTIQPGSSSRASIASEGSLLSLRRSINRNLHQKFPFLPESQRLPTQPPKLQPALRLPLRRPQPTPPVAFSLFPMDATAACPAQNTIRSSALTTRQTTSKRRRPASAPAPARPSSNSKLLPANSRRLPTSITPSARYFAPSPRTASARATPLLSATSASSCCRPFPE